MGNGEKLDTRAPTPRVLVVDDNPLITNVLKSLLGSEHYEVESCANGQEALDLLGQSNVDLIICDVMMPVLDGYGLHEQIRSRSEFAHIPFIFLTALGENEEVERGVGVGADDYVVKPFDPRQLLAMVRGKLQRSQLLMEQSEQQKELFRKRIIHTLSHEFRTPLVAINTGTELLLERERTIDTDKVQNLLEAIQRGGQRLEKLVNDFMLMQQIEAGIGKRLFDERGKKEVLADAVSQYCEIKAEELEQIGYTLKLSNFSGGAEVKLYMPHLQDMLERVIENSVKFSGSSRTIEIVITRLDGEVSLEIRDRGIGMNVSKVRDAIDAFGQVDREKLEQQGGGLGLALVSRYAEIQGGRLEIASRENGGSIVRIVFPIA